MKWFIAQNVTYIKEVPVYSYQFTLQVSKQYLAENFEGMEWYFTLYANGAGADSPLDISEIFEASCTEYTNYYEYTTEWETKASVITAIATINNESGSELQKNNTSDSNIVFTFGDISASSEPMYFSTKLTGSIPSNGGASIEIEDTVTGETSPWLFDDVLDGYAPDYDILVDYPWTGITGREYIYRIYVTDDMGEEYGEILEERFIFTPGQSKTINWFYDPEANKLCPFKISLDTAEISSSADWSNYQLYIYPSDGSFETGGDTAFHVYSSDSISSELTSGTDIANLAMESDDGTPMFHLFVNNIGIPTANYYFVIILHCGTINKRYHITTKFVSTTDPDQNLIVLGSVA